MLRQLLAMEYLAAVQALEFHRPLRSSPTLEEAVARLRERIPRLQDDRLMAPDIAEAADLVVGLADLIE